MNRTHFIFALLAFTFAIATLTIYTHQHSLKRTLSHNLFLSRKDSLKKEAESISSFMNNTTLLFSTKGILLRQKSDTVKLLENKVQQSVFVLKEKESKNNLTTQDLVNFKLEIEELKKALIASYIESASNLNDLSKVSDPERIRDRISETERKISEIKNKINHLTEDRFKVEITSLQTFDKKGKVSLNTEKIKSLELQLSVAGCLTIKHETIQIRIIAPNGIIIPLEAGSQSRKVYIASSGKFIDKYPFSFKKSIPGKYEVTILSNSGQQLDTRELDLL